MSKRDKSQFTISPNPITEAQITLLYSYLRDHSFTKYNRVDEDIIQGAVIKALSLYHQYNPKKCKFFYWVWIIYKNMLLQEIDPKYNKKIKHHYSMDYKYEDQKYSDIIKEASTTPDEFTFDISQYTLTQEIVSYIKENDYPLLKLKLKGLNHINCVVESGLSDSDYSLRLVYERETLKRYVLRNLDDGYLLLERAKTIRRVKRVGQKVQPYSTLRMKICTVCKCEFEATNKRICSDECRKVARSKYKDTYMSKVIKNENGELIKNVDRWNAYQAEYKRLRSIKSKIKDETNR